MLSTEWIDKYSDTHSMEAATPIRDSGWGFFASVLPWGHAGSRWSGWSCPRPAGSRPLPGPLLRGGTFRSEIDGSKPSERAAGVRFSVSMFVDAWKESAVCSPLLLTVAYYLCHHRCSFVKYYALIIEIGMDIWLCIQILWFGCMSRAH